jgi:hypothetical protein
VNIVCDSASSSLACSSVLGAEQEYINITAHKKMNLFMSKKLNVNNKKIEGNVRFQATGGARRPQERAIPSMIGITNWFTKRGFLYSSGGLNSGLSGKIAGINAI